MNRPQLIYVDGQYIIFSYNSIINNATQNILINIFCKNKYALLLGISLSMEAMDVSYVYVQF